MKIAEVVQAISGRKFDPAVEGEDWNGRLLYAGGEERSQVIGTFDMPRGRGHSERPWRIPEPRLTIEQRLAAVEARLAELESR